MKSKDISGSQKALAYAMNDTIGTRISLIEMHEFFTVIVFENRLSLRYETTGLYIFDGHEALVLQEDRAKVFEMLSHAYGQEVISMEISDLIELKIEFSNGFTFIVGSQNKDEAGYEQFEIHHQKFGIFVAQTEDIVCWSKSSQS